jgi:hypothetical protein
MSYHICTCYYANEGGCETRIIWIRSLDRPRSDTYSSWAGLAGWWAGPLVCLLHRMHYIRRYQPLPAILTWRPHHLHGPLEAPLPPLASGGPSWIHYYAEKVHITSSTFAKVCFSSFNSKPGKTSHSTFKIVHLTSLALL